MIPVCMFDVICRDGFPLIYIFFFFFWKALYSLSTYILKLLQVQRQDNCQLVGDLPSALFDAL